MKKPIDTKQFKTYNFLYTGLLIARFLDKAENRGENVEELILEIGKDKEIILGLRVAISEYFYKNANYKATLQKVLSGTSSSENQTITQPSQKSERE